MPQAATTEIKGVELLPVGVWNGVPLTKRDLEDIVTAFNETHEAKPVTIRLGHDARQAFAKFLAKLGGLGDKEAALAAADSHGWPNMGQPSRLYLRGDMLMGDMVNVPAKVASWAANKTYKSRSVGLVFNSVVNGKPYRWRLDHVALLGADTPAVDGLADIGLSEDDADRAVSVTFSASDADGWLNGEPGETLLGAGESGDMPAETALDKCLTALSAVMDEYTPLIYGRKGGPMARQLFAAFTKALRESARAELPLSSTGDDKAMTFTLAAVRGILNLADDAPAADVVAALKSADEATAAKVVELAATGFESADQLVGWLAGALQLAPGDLDGIAAKVAKLNGGDMPDAPATDPNMPADPAAPDATGGNMSAKDAPAVTPDMVTLSAAYMAVRAELDELKADKVKRDHIAKVTADLGSKSVPQPVFDTLVNLSVSGDAAGYATVLKLAPAVPTTEVGTAKGKDVSLELSAIEKTFAKQHGVSEEEYRAQKLANAGIVQGA